MCGPSKPTGSCCKVQMSWLMPLNRTGCAERRITSAYHSVKTRFLSRAPSYPSYKTLCTPGRISWCSSYTNVKISLRLSSGTLASDPHRCGDHHHSKDPTTCLTINNRTTPVADKPRTGCEIGFGPIVVRVLWNFMIPRLSLTISSKLYHQHQVQVLA